MSIDLQDDVGHGILFNVPGDSGNSQIPYGAGAAIVARRIQSTDSNFNTGLEFYANDGTVSGAEANLALIQKIRGDGVRWGQDSTNIPGSSNTVVGAAFIKSSGVWSASATGASHVLNRNEAGSILSFRNAGTEVGKIETQAAATKIWLSANIFIATGTGSPEGNVTGRRGCIYLRQDASAGTTVFYVKVTGTGNTGWGAASIT